ncbi:MAG: hypothetical protein HY578_06635 [Nitrospinae bacterium]|jgi:hypothetical protein|nr:hypothetical protein [Nitrospinota bacterium]
MIKGMNFYHLDNSTIEFIGNVLLTAIIIGIGIIVFLILTTSVASHPTI